MTYDVSLKNGNFRQSRILGSEATLDIDSAVRMTRDRYSTLFKDAKIDADDYLYYYEPDADIDAISTATSEPISEVDTDNLYRWKNNRCYVPTRERVD